MPVCSSAVIINSTTMFHVTLSELPTAILPYIYRLARQLFLGTFCLRLYYALSIEIPVIMETIPT